VLRTASRQKSRQQIVRRGAVSALAIIVGIGGVLKASAQAPQPPAQDQQAPPQQQQTPQPPVSAAPQTPVTPQAPSPTQSRLPQIVVVAPKAKPKTNTVWQQPVAPQPDAAAAAQAALDTKMQSFDQERNNLLPKIGASTYTITRDTIERMPQGVNTPIDKVILQMPGVSYDSAVSNPNFHVRNEYANVQIRIDGIVIPEGVSALGPFLDTNFIGGMSLLTGALPAEYGLRTAGVLDITSRAFATPGGEISLYGGSRQTLTPTIDYGGSFGNSEYFVSATGNWNSLGLENPTAGLNAIHDQTEQGKFFGYASTLLDESTRFSAISAASYSKFQIPNNPGQMPIGDFPVPTPVTSSDSTTLNENEFDSYYVTMAALQKHGTDGDAQLAVYSRYAEVHFVPDPFGDMVFNDVSSNVIRQSTMTGMQGDGSYIVNNQHTLRGGFAVSGEQTNVTNVSTVMPGDVMAVTGPAFAVTDQTSLLGWNIGAYVQDEWKVTNQLTLNIGARFDQLYQFVDANQLSPRFGFVYRPLGGTSIHAGYARYFTPPYQAQATQSNIALFANTTNQPELFLADPVKPERSHYFDVGIDQTVLPGLDVGLDAYYKMARDMIDDGQFGAAVVLTQFNYARGYSEGGEFKLKYHNGNFNAYANFAYNITRAIDVESNQYLFDAATYDFLLHNYHYTDDMQLMTGSAGVSYRFPDTTMVTADMTYGSGLRTGDLSDGVVPNSLHTTPYAVINTGITHDFRWSPDAKPLTVRFDVVNLFDQTYELRDGSGIGVFAPQYGARRGYYMGLSQKL
jgi:outer membrane receptor protein involved in Fe transport